MDHPSKLDRYDRCDLFLALAIAQDVMARAIDAPNGKLMVELSKPQMRRIHVAQIRRWKKLQRSIQKGVL